MLNHTLEHELMAANRLAFGPATGRLFYSGYPAALAALRSAMTANPGLGRSILESPVGKLLSQANLSDSINKAAWTAASYLWAAGAGGSVNAWVVEIPSASSIWVTTELPAVTQNPNVFYPINYPPF